MHRQIEEGEDWTRNDEENIKDDMNISDGIKRTNTKFNFEKFHESSSEVDGSSMSEECQNLNVTICREKKLALKSSSSSSSYSSCSPYFELEDNDLPQKMGTRKMSLENYSKEKRKENFLVENESSNLRVFDENNVMVNEESLDEGFKTRSTEIPVTDTSKEDSGEQEVYKSTIKRDSIKLIRYSPQKSKEPKPSTGREKKKKEDDYTIVKSKSLEAVPLKSCLKNRYLTSKTKRRNTCKKCVSFSPFTTELSVSNRLKKALCRLEKKKEKNTVVGKCKSFDESKDIHIQFQDWKAKSDSEDTTTRKTYWKITYNGKVLVSKVNLLCTHSWKPELRVKLKDFIKHRDRSIIHIKLYECNKKLSHSMIAHYQTDLYDLLLRANKETVIPLIIDDEELEITFKIKMDIIFFLRWLCYNDPQKVVDFIIGSSIRQKSKIDKYSIIIQDLSLNINLINFFHQFVTEAKENTLHGQAAIKSLINTGIIELLFDITSENDEDMKEALKFFITFTSPPEVVHIWEKNKQFIIDMIDITVGKFNLDELVFEYLKKLLKNKKIRNEVVDYIISHGLLTDLKCANGDQEFLEYFKKDHKNYLVRIGLLPPNQERKKKAIKIVI